MERKQPRKFPGRQWDAICMTRRVIRELEQQNLHSHENLEQVLEPEIERLDALERASERLLAEDPERWQPMVSLYSELADLLRDEASELQDEIAVHESLIEALREDLSELEGRSLECAGLADGTTGAPRWRRETGW